MSRYILALDQGTTSSRAILFDRSGNPPMMHDGGTGRASAVVK